MFLRHLTLTNFKNYSKAHLDFREQVICFVGENGAGKTNLLDAIHYTCLTKSYFNAYDTQNIQHQQDFLRIEAQIEQGNEQHHLVCTTGTGNNTKKQITCNKVPYTRMAEHIGKFPVVMIAPDDTAFIKGGSEDRRRFLDYTLSQLEQTYLTNLMQYNKALQQRNALLKQFAAQHTFDQTLLDTWSEQLIHWGNPVHARRKAFLEVFVPIFEQNYQTLSQEKEQVNCQYTSALLQHSFQELLARLQNDDRALKRTTAGIHRDDIEFLINQYPVKKYGSQGQQKSFLIALKLAQYQLLHQEKQVQPFLLLDDIFDKLDESRIQQLLQMIQTTPYGQIFLTDAHTHRIDEIFANFNIAYQKFHVQNGRIMEER